jgi:PPOX class probable F420-dependent enzyme
MCAPAYHPGVDVEQARDFIRQHHRAILATVRADGGTQMSPVLAGIDDDGFVEVSSNEGKAKVRNLRRDPRATLLVMTERFFERRWIQIDGMANVVALPEAADALIAYERRMAGDGEMPPDEELRGRHAEGRAVLVRISIDRVGPKNAKLDPS